MADAVDLAEEINVARLAASLTAIGASLSAEGADVCEECDIPIPPARRAAYPASTRCVGCQGIHELKNRHRGF